MPINLTTLISWTFFAKHKPWSLTKDELKTQIVSYLSKIFNALSNGKYQVQVALFVKSMKHLQWSHGTKYDCVIENVSPPSKTDFNMRNVSIVEELCLK